MTLDDFIYALLLLISVFIGPISAKLFDGIRKKFIFAAVGLIFSVIVCGHFIWHSLLTTIGLLALIKVIKRRYIHIAALVWCFGYLAFFRTADWWGFLKPSPHSNAVQLLLTLRLIGVCFELHDSANLRVLKEDANKNSEECILKMRYNYIDPSFMEVFFYAYCYTGLLTGPFFKYKTYEDMIRQTPSDEIPTTEFLLKRIRDAPFYGIIYLLLSHYYYIDYAKTDEFFERNFLYRFYFMVMMFIVFRCRMYFAWIMSECVCMAVGLGAYPEISKPRCGAGPTDLVALRDLEERKSQDTLKVTYSYETIHNIDIHGCELTPTVREGMKAWNMTVQFWLANFIYRRVHLRSIRTSVTMAVSAYWHGVHPGYYLSFLTIPLCLSAETSLNRILSKFCSPAVAWWVRWIFKMRVFDYTCMGFLLLTAADTLNYWFSIYLCIHIISVLFLTVDKFLLPKVVTEKSDVAQTSAETKSE